MKLTSQMPSSASLNIVAGLPRYAEIPANVRHGLAIQQAGHKAKALFHHRTRFPRHQHLPSAKGDKCYPCVRYGISPMPRAAHGTPHATGALAAVNTAWWPEARCGNAPLPRYGDRIGMLEPRIKLGQYLFLRHGAKVVLLGRLVASLRILAAFLAGLIRMRRRAFLID